MSKTSFPKGAALIAIIAILAGTGWWYQSREAKPVDMVVYKSASCGCCGQWVTYLEARGLTVEVQNEEDMDAVKRRLGVPEAMESCHTAVMGDYLVEGHVPFEDLQRLQKEKPAVKGIAAPGMPAGSPGMETPGTPAEPYDVVTFDAGGNVKVFARH